LHEVLHPSIENSHCQVSATRIIGGSFCPPSLRVLNLCPVISVSFVPLKKKLQQTPTCSKLSLPGYRVLYSLLLHGHAGLDATVRKILLLIAMWSCWCLICIIYYPLSCTHRNQTTVMCCLMTGVCSEKCVIRWFHHCANVIQCTYTNLDSIAYCTPMLCGIAYCS
jgi:hypothetical protein